MERIEVGDFWLVKIGKCDILTRTTVLYIDRKVVELGSISPGLFYKLSDVEFVKFREGVL